MPDAAILLFQRSQLGEIIHPFVVSEVNEFCKMFKRVVLICFDYTCDDSELKKHDNLEIYTVSLRSAKRNYSAMLKLFSIPGYADMKTAIANRVPLKQYLKNTAQVLMFGNALAKKAIQIIESSCTDTSWIVEGYWFSGPAYAAAVLKERFSDKMFTVARAHSSEIDIRRNKAAVCMMKNYIAPRLNRIFFVSRWGEALYLNHIMPLYSTAQTNNTVVCGLGVDKLYASINEMSTDGVFRILTCSRAVKLKRLDLLAEALRLYRGEERIEWTHIGDGSELDKIKNLMKKSPDAILYCMGAMTNEEVHKYLSESPVDLFVNTSEFEGLPISIIEAFAYGIPCIATAAGGTSELVDDNTGKLLPIEITPDVLLETILEFKKETKDNMLKVRKNAYYKWENEYSKSSNYQFFFQMINHCEKSEIEIGRTVMHDE